MPINNSRPDDAFKHDAIIFWPIFMNCQNIGDLWKKYGEINGANCPKCIEIVKRSLMRRNFPAYRKSSIRIYTF